MKPIITKFSDKTGDFEITIPVPFTLKDGIEYADMMIADIPKYEDTKDYNVFDLIRENQGLKKQLEIGKEQYNDLVEEKEELQEQLSNSHQINAQQKEFIEYLEDKLNMCDGFLDTIKSDLEEISYAGRASGKTYIATQIMKNEIAEKCYEEVLSKYKEIVGGNNDQ